MPDFSSWKKSHIFCLGHLSQFINFLLLKWQIPVIPKCKPFSNTFQKHPQCVSCILSILYCYNNHVCIRGWIHTPKIPTRTAFKHSETFLGFETSKCLECLRIKIAEVILKILLRHQILTFWWTKTNIQAKNLSACIRILLYIVMTIIQTQACSKGREFTKTRLNLILFCAFTLYCHWLIIYSH